MKKLLYISLFFGFGLNAVAQQEAMFTHYMFNTLNINSGYAGSRNALSVVAINRNQWVGFEGAPITQTVSLHSPLFKKSFAGGLTIMKDKIGPTNLSTVTLDLAYRMKVSETATLSFGLKGGLNVFNSQLTTLDLTTQGDQSFSNNFKSKLMPNFGFGMYYQSTRFYAGLSTPKILENSTASSAVSGGNFLSTKRHYYFIGGGIFNLSPRLVFRPSTFVKATLGAPLEVDLTSLFVVDDLFWGGAMFRTGDAVGLLFGININKQLQFGYSFDWSYAINSVTSKAGSHEIMLRYDFIFRDKEKIRSPRYF